MYVGSRARQPTICPTQLWRFTWATTTHSLLLAHSEQDANPAAPSNDHVKQTVPGSGLFVVDDGENPDGGTTCCGLRIEDQAKTILRTDCPTAVELF